MGRALLTLCAVALLTACGADDHEGTRVALGADGVAASAPDPHRDLPCAACHAGGLSDGRLPAVPRTSCATSGCHQEGGPSMASTATATFRHRDHARDGEVALSCAGCHTHAAGTERLTVSLDGCALCHIARVESDDANQCRLCHVKPQHVALTSQALPIPHSSLPWIETGCVRCHYDVAEPPVKVDAGRCAGCHARDTTVMARAIGTDLHPAHVSVNCNSCHEGEAHRVRAMSSAVQLVCADCHVREHALEIVPDPAMDVTCNGCHETVHQAQQKLLLGMMPGEAPSPSSKFIAGITCRSCHIRNARTASSGDAIRGQAEACSGCHRTEYRQVLQWWLEGSRARTASVGTYVDRAARDLGAGAPDSARVLVQGAQALVGLVREAGGQHNLELSDRIFREAVQRVEAAYRVGGRAAPAAPALGSTAHEGMCSYCHYSPNEPWDFRRMSGPFHRSVLGLDR
jgi:hypothetical protein